MGGPKETIEGMLKELFRKGESAGYREKPQWPSGELLDQTPNTLSPVIHTFLRIVSVPVIGETETDPGWRVWSIEPKKQEVPESVSVVNLFKLEEFKNQGGSFLVVKSKCIPLSKLKKANQKITSKEWVEIEETYPSKDP
mgnify:CR=1 FL=1